MADAVGKFTWRDDEDPHRLLELKREYDRMEFSPTSPGKSFTSHLSQQSAASHLQYAMPEQTLIFLDWDDTLFPSTELFERWKYPSRPEKWSSMSVPEDQEAVMARWREALFEFLIMATSQSDRVAIVTNSRRPWVTDCVAHFAPNCLPLFEKPELRVVYAQEVLSKKANPPRPVTYHDHEQPRKEEFEAKQTNAKFVAMKKETQDFYSRYKGQTWKNILSLGDMRFEHDALQEVTFTRVSPPGEEVRTKTITIAENPSLTLLIIGMKLRTIYLPVCVHFNGDFDISLGNSGPGNLKKVADALNLPELADLTLLYQIEFLGAEELEETLDAATVIAHNALHD